MSIVQDNPKIKELLTPKLTEYIAFTPTIKQQAFLCLDCEEAFFGGAAGGAKSVGLLMAALQYVDIPGYNALLIRDTYQNLTKPEGLIPLAHEWLSSTDAEWKEGNHYLFPSGATLNFGYLSGPLDHFNYQSAAYQFIGIDEIVAIRENQALYLFSRLRRKKLAANIPLRFRCASNPPAREQVAKGAWVKARYVDSETRKKDIIFIPSKLEDNPHIDAKEYKEKSLSKLDPITRRQLEEGDWNVQASGDMFRRDWFQIVDVAPEKHIKEVRFWDLAGTENKNKDAALSGQPAYTAGLRMGVTPDGLYFIKSVIRDQLSPRRCEALIRQTADMDGRNIPVWMFQDPGQAGKSQIDHYRRNVLRGFIFRGRPATTAKTQMWAPFASQAEGGNVYLVKGHWNSDFLDEVELAPHGPFLDQIDAAGGAFDILVGIGTGIKPRIRVV